MAFPLTLPTIGSTSWGSDVNANWTTINDAFQTLAAFTGKVTITPTVAGSGTQTALAVTGAANTNQTASTEVSDLNLNLARTVQWATGALTTQRAVLVQAPTYAFVGSSTITNAATLAITGAPAAGTNATLTNAYALWIQAGTSRFDGLLLTKGSATGSAGVNLPHGAAPSSPVDGDLWTTSSGLYVRINGSTVGPLGTGGGGGGVSGSGATNQVSYWSGTTSLTGITGFTFTPGTPNALAVPGTLALSPAAASGAVASALTVTGAADTALTASTERTDINFNLARTVQFATGALTTQRAVRFQAPTYGFVGASTITTAATVAIGGAPAAGTNATLTNAYALWVQAGKARFDGGITSPLGSLTTHSEFFGFQAGNGSYTAPNTLGVGYQALTAVTSGEDLTAIGTSAGAALTDQDRWVAVGYNAAAAGGSGNDVIAIGWNAVAGATGGSSISCVTAVGSEACRYVNAETHVGIGYQACRGSTTSSNNNGDANVAVGYQTLLNFTSGSDNVAVGYQALTALTTGNNNVAVGLVAGGSVITGSDSIYIGAGAGGGATESDKSIFIGSNAGQNLGSAADDNNIAIGYEAFKCSGTAANNDGHDNLAIGYRALRDATHAVGNVALGSGSMTGITSGNANVGVGMNTLLACTTGSSSVALGYSALSHATTGGTNIAVGSAALENLETGSNNIAIGPDAGHELVTGSNNWFVGQSAGQNTPSNASRLAVFGGGGSAGYTDFYFGDGDFQSSPGGNVTLHATSGLGSNISGMDLSIAAGAPTGNAAGGDIIFQTAKGGTSGTSLASLNDRFAISSDGAFRTFGIATSSAPATSASNTGALFYDSTLQAFRASLNTGSYTNLVTGAGSTNQVATWSSAGALTGYSAFTFDGSTLTVNALIQSKASATGGAGLNVPHGAAPTLPVNGDIWTTNAGLYVRINGTTIGPLN